MTLRQYKLLAMIFLAGFAMWFIPHSQGISAQSWHLFTIFLMTIVAIILSPMPLGALALMSIAVAVVTKTLTISQGLSGFSNHIVWLVVFAFFISRGFSKTNLGRRIAYYFISKLGRSTLGLSYGLVFTEFLLSPLIPSVTARGGGIIFPIAQSLVKEYERENGAASHRTAGFIMKICFHANVITSAMFITAMAANPLIVKIALDAGVYISWGTWAIAALVPGVASLLLLPLILFSIYTPDIKTSEAAPKIAAEELANMGPLSRAEWTMLGTFVFLIGFWIFGTSVGINATTTALMGFIILLLTGVLTWSDAINEKGAWNTFTWFATLIMLSGFLTEFGLISWLGQQIDGFVNVDQKAITMIGCLLFFFFIHVIFASITALVSTLYATLLLVLISVGVDPLIAALSLGFTGIISSGLTHFGIASAPIFYGAGYINTKIWWKLGFIVAITNLVIWSVACAGWWKILGWY